MVWNGKLLIILIQTQLKSTTLDKKLLELKSWLKKNEATYNSCLLNLYNNGEEGMSGTVTTEKSFKKWGQSYPPHWVPKRRKFAFKLQINQRHNFCNSEHGSLLIMKDETQTHCRYRLPQYSRKTTTPLATFQNNCRINFKNSAPS